ncbi:MAG: DUF4160 domain-containing protein [Bacteroidales bacterium]|nr:DUF4160 domain-containing protein [Bacteroidales bacterium]
MPTIYEYFGFFFLFYSNEHEPIHVHVQHGDRESIFEIILYKNKLQQINVRAKRGSKPLTSKEMKTAEAFIQKYYPNIVEKWVNYFVKKQNVRKTTIKTKL